MRIVTSSVLAVLALAMSSGMSLAATINVPADQPSIQAAIDAAAAGDEVVVAPGLYLENINFKGKAITVRSAAGPAVTTIDGRALGSVVIFNTGEGQGSVLRGFTLRNGSAGSSGGGGIRISNTSPRILNNIVKNNTACGSGPGIYVYFGSPLILGNTVTDNTPAGCTGGSGGGITVQGTGSAQVVNNTVRNNRNTFGGGIGIGGGGTAVIRNNVITGNTATSRGGGMDMVNTSSVLIVQNLITGNTAPEGGGIAWSVPSGNRGPRLVNNTLADNNATTQGRGSAIYASGFDKDVDVVNNILAGRSGQTAVHCDGTHDPMPRFKSNDVYAASGTLYGGTCTNQTGVNGNLSADPLFTADFLLQAGSPCLDQGDSVATDIPLTDLKGKARVLDGNGDGSAVIDLGVGEG